MSAARIYCMLLLFGVIKLYFQMLQIDNSNLNVTLIKNGWLIKAHYQSFFFAATLFHA